MKLEIERLAITLQGVAPDTGGLVTDLLGRVLTQRLAGLDLHAVSADLAQADLGTIDAPAGIDVQALTDLIAGRLIDWLEREHGAASATHNSGKGH